MDWREADGVADLLLGDGEADREAVHQPDRLEADHHLAEQMRDAGGEKLLVGFQANV
jgi:hypothetical protein